MRILHIGKYFPPVPGGIERFLGDLLRAQRAAGHESAALVHDDDTSLPGDDPPWLMRAPVWFRLFFAPISPTFGFSLSRAISRYQPDVLHIHMPNLSAFWALFVLSARRIPWVIHWHADVEVSQRSLRFAYPHYRIFERAVLERAECIIATSTQYLDASDPLAPWRHKCHVIPLGVAPERLPEVKESEWQCFWRGQGLRILAVGRLTYYKGFETLLKAVLGASGMELIIVGGGEERSRLEKIIAESYEHPPPARLFGETDDSTLCKLLASCDVFCLPSLERTEAFGIVLMEAMRYAKPLVVSELAGSGVTHVARAGQNAFLVKPGDVEALRSALEKLAAAPVTRQLLGHLGYQRYLREFDIGRIEPEIEAIYRLALRVHKEESFSAVPVAQPMPLDDEEIRGEPIGARRLLAVIPALNEAADIAEVIEKVRAYPGMDVLVVDDGSTDETAAVALVSGAKVLRAPLWQGAWGAIQTGLRYALRHGYSGVVTMDADGQHEPEYLPRLLEAASQADVVIAACPSRGSRMRHIAWTYFRFLTGFNLDDLTSGFRYYNADACRLLVREEATLLDYQDIGVLLLLRHARLRIAEVPVEMNPRKHGASRVFSSWWTVARYMAETTLLCMARWNQDGRRRVEPRGIAK
jgi:glycosyltransferase involved in cell wall biosynthesis